MPAEFRQFSWKHLAAAVALVGASVLINWEPWKNILQIGMSDEESSHILLVPAVVAWIVWVRRERLRNCRPGKRWVGVLLIALGWLISTVGYRYDIRSFWHGGPVVMLAGCILVAFGRDLLMRFAPAFIALLFLVPMPSSIRQRLAVPLQNYTAKITQVSCETLGMNVSQAGAMLTINGQDVAIAEACNGTRMVFTLLYVAYTFAFITPLHGSVRLLILVLSPLLALVCNVIRLVPTVWFYGNFSPETADTFHDISGWVMLVVGFLLLLGVLRLLQWALVPIRPYHLALAD